MRLILLDQETNKRFHFNPQALSRPIWELRCGITSLAEKLIAAIEPADTACFVPPYMAEVYAARTDWAVNDAKSLLGDDLFIVSPRVRAEFFAEEKTKPKTKGPSRVKFDADGDCLFIRVAKEDVGKLQTDSIGSLIESARTAFESCKCDVPTWNYTWDLILESPAQLTKDFAALGRSGIEGTIEEPSGIRGSKGDIFIGRGAVVHPLVVLDAKHGPIYLDEGVVVHPFTRIEGPCYVGRKSILLGAKCREGNSIGPMCRVGGEVEESIIQGHSNKYHDGFLGHAYVGEWVNLGAGTTNSDLKNDYTNVSLMLDGRTPIDTGSTKVGALIGDHTKTSIGVLFNTGSYVGAMALIAATGKLLPKFIPSFAWFIEGVVTKGFGKAKLYETAATAMSRRKSQWTEADRKMWDEIFKLTDATRRPAIAKGRRELVRG